MKLLHVVDSMDPQKGGVSRAVQMMAVQIDRLGMHNEVVCLDNFETVSLYNLFIIHALGPAKGPWRYSDKLVPWLHNNFARFDTIIVHGIWLYHSYGVIKALNQFKKQLKKLDDAGTWPKVFIMPHGMLDPYFQRAGKRKLKAIRNWLYWKLVEGRVINNADGLLFSCREECRLANQVFTPYHPRHKLIVGLGVAEPPSFTASMSAAFYSRCPEIENKSYILFLSRIDPKKGIEMLLEAYEQVIKEIASAKKMFRLTNQNESPCNDFQSKEFPKLVIAGPGLETVYGQKIQHMVSTVPLLHTSVSFPGMLHGDSKWGALYGCDAFILPSHQENFGISVVEALACSKPVLITTPVNISAEIKAKDGGLVEADTLEGTYNLLESWRKMPDGSKLTMGDQARRCFENDFEISEAVNRFITLMTHASNTK